MKGVEKMGVNVFDENQMKALAANPYVVKVTPKSVQYSQEFKEIFWLRYSHGEKPTQILRSMKMKPEILGRKRIYNLTKRVCDEANRLEGFTDTRRLKRANEPPKEMSVEEHMTYLEEKIQFQQHEIEFLKEKLAEKEALLLQYEGE